MNKFEIEKVRLEESNLIEASAGTGKTYSIAILVLRLMLEKNLPLKEILMVTFTKAAVEELETRIRDFIRKAAIEAEGGDGEDALIRSLVQDAIKKQGSAEIQLRLKNATLLLDETSILTIHSFCQRTLEEYAFETGQVFGVQTLSTDELEGIVVNALNQFWRTYITSLDVRIIKQLGSDLLSRKQFKKYIDTALSGKTWVCKQTDYPDFLEVSDQQVWVDKIKVAQIAYDAHFQGIIQKILEDDFDKYTTAVRGNRHALRNFDALFQQKEGEKIFEQIRIGFQKQTAYIRTIFADLEPAFKKLDELDDAKNAIIADFYGLLVKRAIDFVQGKVRVRKEDKNLITFDDMIINLHKAIAIDDKPAILKALRSKYKAAFIDEFQDTDKLQYEIFDRIFGNNTILFYIGDPKQAIYSFRKADIFTYFKAAAAVKHQYSMNTNFRSSNDMIAVMNRFFMPHDGYDTFYFQNQSPGINYLPVQAPVGDTKGQLVCNGIPVTAMQWVEGGSQLALQEATIGWVTQLLEMGGAYTLKEKDAIRPIKPSDIGILVRTNKQGRAIKELLSIYNIPSITIDDTKILKTDEALEILYLLEAVYDITPASVNKALLTDLAGLTVNDIIQLNEESVLQRFKAYQQSWNKEGVYVMLMMFITDYQLKRRWLSGDKERGERRLSNVLQLLELLNKMQTNKQYAPAELINWLRKGLEETILEGDEMEQRIESDEDAVKIVSIHKSKGLEYNIVIAPHLDLKAELRPDQVQFRDPQTEEYFFGREDQLDQDQCQQAVLLEKQENRRLLYVAITRAKYACFIGRNTDSRNASSCLRDLIEEHEISGTQELQKVDKPTVPQGFRFTQVYQFDPVQFKKADQFELLQPTWRKMSYSFLNPEHTPASIQARQQLKDDYDKFIFHDLKKGAHTGNLLHYIFEHIDFSDKTYWERLVKQALKRLSIKEDPHYVEGLMQMLDHVMNTPLDGFSLSEVSRDDRLNELEFDFNVNPFQTSHLQSLSSPTAPLLLRYYSDLEGVMNGKIDLFFRMNGKYYVLDWKSNFLGDDLEQYDQNGVQSAMTENNYHLQYHIYSIAAKRFLESRISGFNYEQDFGGVIYLFLRGIRKDKSTGIFKAKLTEQQVSLMNDVLQGDRSTIHTAETL